MYHLCGSVCAVVDCPILSTVYQIKKVYRFLGFTHHKTKKKNWTISWKKLTFFVFFGCCDHLLAVILVKMWTYSKTFIYHLKGHNTIYKCYKYQRDIDFSSKDIIHWIWKNTIFAIFFFFQLFQLLGPFSGDYTGKNMDFFKTIYISSERT